MNGRTAVLYDGNLGELADLLQGEAVGTFIEVEVDGRRHRLRRIRRAGVLPIDGRLVLEFDDLGYDS